MIKMKLPMKTGDETAEDDSSDPSERQHIPRAASPPSVYERSREPPRPRVHPSHLDRESVFEWFGHHSNPAKRIEFMCGSSHMCQPSELRFSGSYLEDLAKKDYHVLRDFECRANNPSELGILTDVLDPVVRSKLIVCSSSLGSDKRECAGILSRILSSVDLALSYRNCDYPSPSFRDPQHPLYPLYPPCQDGSACEQSRGESAAGASEQSASLYTMASLHPAFHFHQREVIRGQSDKIELSSEEEKKRRRQLRINAHSTEPMGQQADYSAPSVQDFAECTASHPPCQSRRSSRWAAQREAVHIEGIVLRGISRTGTEKEYSFEVKWSDSSSSSVTKTHHESENFLLKLPKDQCTESFEKSISRLSSQGDQYESREVEKNLRERFLSAPPLFRQTRKVCSFFNCEPSHSSRPACNRCNYQPGKAYQQDVSDASSQDEESYVSGHKKKLAAKSPSQLLSRAKSPQRDSWRGGGGAESNGPTDRRKKSSSQDTEQLSDPDRRSHPTSKSKSRFFPVDREKADRVTGKGAAFSTNGSLLPASSPQRKGGSSHPDMFGETSSESCSSTSSPQYRRRESSESDDNNKDSDSHSDDGGKGVASDSYFTRQTDPVGLGDVAPVYPSSSRHNPRMEHALTEGGPEFPPLPYMHSSGCVLPNGAATDSPGLPSASAPSQGIVSDGKPPPAAGAMMMPMMPPVLPAPGIVGDPEKRDVLTTFGIQPLALHSSMNAGMQPMVQRFKTASPHSQAGAEAPPGSDTAAAAAPPPPHPHQAPLRPSGSSSPGPSPYSSPPSSCQDPGSPPPSPHMDAPHTKLHGSTLPSGLPSPYTSAPGAASVMPASGASVAPGVTPSVPAAVPSNSPGPAPSLSPSSSLSTAQTDSTSYSSTSASCGSAPVAPGNPITAQQTQQQQAIGCGTCGCHNNCGSRGSSSSGCQPPFYFPHQVAAVARQMFGVPQSLLYLAQAPPPHQANGPPTSPPFFPTAPPPVHPSPYSHPHSQAEVPSHLMSSQAPVAVAAANYGLQQQMAPATSFSQRLYQHVYPSHSGMSPAAASGGGGINKKNGTVSCYNCGVNGHFAQECNQPSMDSTQQGGFRLKYAASNMSEALDNAD